MKIANETKNSDGKKKFTDAQKKRLIEFNRIRGELIENGYKEKNLIITPLKANIMVLVTTGPIAVFLYVLYFVIHGSYNMVSELNMMFYLVLLLGIVAHELIHGITWAAFCKKKWKAIGFGVDLATLTPYCCCNEGLTLKQYSLGCMLPTIIVGLLPYIIGLIFGNHFLAIFGVVHILGGGGDAYIFSIIRKEKSAIIVDHPYLVGCVAFEK